MPLAVTLCLDPAATAPVEVLWRALAEGGIDDDCHRLGYRPHITLAIFPDGSDEAAIAAALTRLAASWEALPVNLAGIGVFPGETSIMWAIPVATPALLDRHRVLLDALPDLPVDPHYRAGAWTPHITLSGPVRDPVRALGALVPLWRPVRAALADLELVRFRPVEVLASHRLRGAGGTG